MYQQVESRYNVLIVVKAVGIVIAAEIIDSVPIEPFVVTWIASMIDTSPGGLLGYTGTQVLSQSKHIRCVVTGNQYILVPIYTPDLRE